MAAHDSTPDRFLEPNVVIRTATAVLNRGFQIGIFLLVAGLILAAIEGEPLSRTVAKPADIVDAASHLEADGLIDLAILWMIAVPVIAAAAIVIAFLRAHEWRYAVTTLLVLAVLTFSIGLAIR
jgi:uncharacterized membrane protein